MLCLWRPVCWRPASDTWNRQPFAADGSTAGYWISLGYGSCNRKNDWPEPGVIGYGLVAPDTSSHGPLMLALCSKTTSSALHRIEPSPSSISRDWALPTQGPLLALLLQPT